MGQLQSNHGRQRCHDSSKELGSFNEKLRVQEKDATQAEIPSLQLVHDLPHNGDVCVQLNLTCRSDVGCVCMTQSDLQVRCGLFVYSSYSLVQ